jgi:zinc transport system permease protein
MGRTMIGEMLGLPFFRQALLGGVLVVTMLSVLSFFIVLRRLSFIGVGISHSALGGVALGIALGFNPIISTTFFCAGIALIIGFVSRRGHVREDAAIGITFSGTMALGVVLISVSGAYATGLFSYLFGSILAITPGDIYVIAVYCGVVLVCIAALFPHLLSASFDEDTAKVAGVRTGPLYYLLLVLVALAIVASIKLVGIVLVSAMLVLPAATASQIARGYRRVMALSIITGLVSLVAGMTLSYWFDLPSGATIVLCSCLLFFTCFAAARLRHKLNRTHGG